ncbi:MAG TPA: helix-turn-helix domain-containing protein [Planktothrix sp.]|jgi:transcriptional regulator with XRE-family HTH domain
MADLTDSTKESAVIEQLSAPAALFYLARIIRRRRKKLGLSTESVASRTKVSMDELLALEHGKWDIDILSLADVAQCLEMDLKQLLRECRHAPRMHRIK